MTTNEATALVVWDRQGGELASAVRELCGELEAGVAYSHCCPGAGPRPTTGRTEW